MRTFILFFLLISSGICYSQLYNPYTDQADQFSKSFVEILNCAKVKFKHCQGDSMRTTWLMGTDYKLTIKVPGSNAGIVRERDWDKNAYLEFGPFNDTVQLRNGMIELVGKMKLALGANANIPHELISGPNSSYFITSLGLKDANGYFQSNIELMSGAAARDNYFPEPEKEPEVVSGKKYFIILKVYSGIPEYQYYIRELVQAPDSDLDVVLKYFIEMAKTDFRELEKKDSNVRKQKTDTILMNGIKVLFNPHGQNASATISIETNNENFISQWKSAQQSLQAALGEKYVYHLYEMYGQPFVSYYALEYDPVKPRIYLEGVQKNNSERIIEIKISSAYTRQVKRNLSYD
jgi:hypothetical protein